MKGMSWVLLLGLAVAGCASTPKPVLPPDRAAAPETIRYESGPCFGSCPAFNFTITAEGKGSFVGIGNTQVLGARAFTVLPDQYRTFATALAPYRPASGERVYENSPMCAEQATDLPSVEVRWSGGSAPSARLYYSFGCDMEKHRAMADALGNAPDLLPALEPLIGPRP